MTARACPFASPSIAEHLARGAGAVSLVGLAYALFHGGGGLCIAGATVALAGAVALARGCPTCWTIGLVATVGAAWRARQTADTSADSSAVATLPASVPAPR